MNSKDLKFKSRLERLVKFLIRTKSSLEDLIPGFPPIFYESAEDLIHLYKKHKELPIKDILEIDSMTRDAYLMIFSTVEKQYKTEHNIEPKSAKKIEIVEENALDELISDAESEEEINNLLDIKNEFKRKKN